jgi:hypothetical protein
MRHISSNAIVAIVMMTAQVLLAQTRIFLRRTLPARSVRFRMNGGMQPVVIVASGTAVGVLMPVKQ